MIKRFIYWLTHKHHCDRCCLFCKFFKECKGDVIEVKDENDDEEV
jgi:hypothetical protein